MLKFFYSKQGGAISVMLSIVLVAILSTSSTLVELGRMKSAQSILHEADINAANSLLADTDSELLKNYGLLALTQEGGSDIIAQKYKEYLEANLGGDVTGVEAQKINSFLTGLQASSAEGIYSLNEQDVLERQILETMKYRAPVEMAATGLEAISNIGIIKTVSDMLAPLKSFADASLNIAEKFTEFYKSFQSLGKAIEAMDTEKKDYNKKYKNLYESIGKMTDAAEKLGEEPQKPAGEEPVAPSKSNYSTTEEYEAALEAWKTENADWVQYNEEHAKWEKNKKKYDKAVENVKKDAASYLKTIEALADATDKVTEAAEGARDAVGSLKSTIIKDYMQESIDIIGAKHAADDLGGMKDNPYAEKDKEKEKAEKKEKATEEAIKSSLELAMTQMDAFVVDAEGLRNEFQGVLNEIGDANLQKEIDYINNTDAEDMTQEALAKVHKFKIDVDKIIKKVTSDLIVGFIKQTFAMVKYVIETFGKMVEIFEIVLNAGFWFGGRSMVNIDNDVWKGLSSKTVAQGASEPTTKADDFEKGTKAVEDAQSVADELGYDTSKLNVGDGGDGNNDFVDALNDIGAGVAEVLDYVVQISKHESDFKIGKDAGLGLKFIKAVRDGIARVIKTFEMIPKIVGALKKVLEGVIKFTKLLIKEAVKYEYEGALIASYATGVFSNRTTLDSEKNIFGASYGDMPRGNSSIDFTKLYEAKIAQIASSFLKGDFSNEQAKATSTNNRSFARAEAEYVLVGSKNEVVNQFTVTLGILIIRCILGLATTATNMEALEVVSATAYFAPLVFILIALLEGVLDTVFIVNGVPVPMIKLTDQMAFFSMKGIENFIDKCGKYAERVVGESQYTLFNSLTGAEDKFTDLVQGNFEKASIEGDPKVLKKLPKGLKPSVDLSGIIGDGTDVSYKAYLWFFMNQLTLCNGTFVKRIGNLIEMKMGVEDGSTFRMSEAYTYVRTSATGKFDLLLPIPGISGTFKPSTVNYAGY